MQFVFYEDAYCYYFWKPENIASSYGKESCFLEYLLGSQEERVRKVVYSLRSEFSQQEEFWLLNRLDTPTSGLLYFAKTQEIKRDYKFLQKNKKIKKFYVLECYGDLSFYVTREGNGIDVPLAHHRYATDRMVAVYGDRQMHKIKGKIHHEVTQIEEYSYSDSKKTSIALVAIHKGVRHQIRAHFAAIGYPLVWDALYWKDRWLRLQLFGVGLQSC